MILYSLLIIFGIILITIFNTIFNPTNGTFWYYFLYTIIATVVLILIDGLVAFFIRKLPAKLFNYNKKIYKASKKEMKLLKFLGVPKWKDYIPELGGFTKFHKNKISEPFNELYIDRYILECCYGYQIHIWSAPLSFLVLLIDIRMYTGSSTIWLTLLLPAAILNAILILLPALILKYNLRRLINIKNLNSKKKNPIKG